MNSNYPLTVLWKKLRCFCLVCFVVFFFFFNGIKVLADCTRTITGDSQSSHSLKLPVVTQKYKKKHWNILGGLWNFSFAGFSGMLQMLPSFGTSFLIFNKTRYNVVTYLKKKVKTMWNLNECGFGIPFTNSMWIRIWLLYESGVVFQMRD